MLPKLFCVIFFFEVTIAMKGATLQKPLSKPKPVPKNCPFYGGIFTSVMRRIFNPGFHK